MHTPYPSKKLDMGKGCVRFSEEGVVNWSHVSNLISCEKCKKPRLTPLFSHYSFQAGRRGNQTSPSAFGETNVKC